MPGQRHQGVNVVVHAADLNGQPADVLDDPAKVGVQARLKVLVDRVPPAFGPEDTVVVQTGMRGAHDVPFPVTIACRPSVSTG